MVNGGNIMKVLWDDYFMQLDELVASIKRDKYDVVLAIGRGGLIPGLYLSKKHNKPMVMLFAERYKDGEPENETRISHITGLHELKREDRILVVDDICDNGTTLSDVVGVLFANSFAIVKTAVVYWRSTSCFTPDYFAKKLNTEDGWVVFPYDR